MFLPPGAELHPQSRPRSGDVIVDWQRVHCHRRLERRQALVANRDDVGGQRVGS